jgi:hypothetical protein
VSSASAGREFRESEEGRRLKESIDGAYQGLEERERATLQVVLSSLDGLLQTIQDLDASLDGHARRNGQNGNRPDPDE